VAAEAMTVAGERQRPGAAEAMAGGGRGSGRRRERQWPAEGEAVAGWGRGSLRRDKRCDNRWRWSTHDAPTTIMDKIGGWG